MIVVCSWCPVQFGGDHAEMFRWSHERIIHKRADPPPAGYRDGATYEADKDYERLNAQQGRVWNAMKDGGWHTLAELETLTGDPQASISARLRDFRKSRFGEWNVERERRQATFYYRLKR